MADILLDTNFIVSCVKKKIDFFEQLEELFPGSKILVPLQVIREIKELSGKGKIADREAAKLSFAIISQKKQENLEIIDLKKGGVDKGILDYAPEKKTTFITATLDKKLRKKLKMLANRPRFLAIRGKRIEVV